MDRGDVGTRAGLVVGDELREHREDDVSEHQDEGGQVSEVEGLEPAGGANDPISPEDATAGYPDGESGDAQEGTAGPNAA